MKRQQLIEIIIDEIRQTRIQESSDPLKSRSLRFLLEDDSTDSEGEPDAVEPDGSPSTEDDDDPPTSPAASRVAVPVGPTPDVLPAAPKDNFDVSGDVGGEGDSAAAPPQSQDAVTVPDGTKLSSAPETTVARNSAAWTPVWDFLTQKRQAQAPESAVNETRRRR
jgi:hypothetical protein